MKIGMRGRALLCALLFIAGCDGERGPAPTPPEGETGDSRSWLQQALAERPGNAKSKESYKSGAPLKAPPQYRSDMQFDKLQQPLESRNTELRAQRIAPEQTAPWRYLVPRKGASAAAAAGAAVAADRAYG